MATLRGKVLLSRLQDGFDVAPAPVLRRALALSLIMIVFIVIQAPLIFEFPINRGDAAIQDFLAFHAAAEGAVSGAAAKLYDPAYFQALVGQQNGLLWFYAPTMLLFLTPFGFLPYGVAKYLWLGASLAGIGAGAWRLGRKNLALALAALLSPAAWALIKTGQLSALFALLACAGLLLSRTRPILAGVLLGLLTVKPQYGLLIPLFLLITGSWRAIFWAAATALFAASLSAVAFGAEAWMSFVYSLTHSHADFLSLNETNMGRITIVDAMRHLGWENAPPLLLYGAGLGVAGGALVLAASRGVSPRTLAALTLMLGFITTPYIWVYDALLINFALIMLIADGKLVSPRAQIAAAVLWFLPLGAYMVKSIYVVPVLWFSAAASVALIYVEALGFKLAELRVRIAGAR